MRKFYKFGIIMLFLLPVALPTAFAYNFEGVCVTYTSSDTTFIYDTVCSQTDTPGSSVQTQIDLSPFAPGIYFIKAVADGNVVAVRKVVKR